jgi:hypothetical protein
VRIYCASKARWAPWWRALQAAGVPLQASWLTWEFNLDPNAEPLQQDWAKHSEICLTEARESDLVLFVAFEDNRPHFGAIMEAAAALSNGKRVFLVSPWALGISAPPPELPKLRYYCRRDHSDHGCGEGRCDAPRSSQ